MKRILVPTDFSSNAENALRYAVEMANAFNADIHLVHSFDLPVKVGIFPKAESDLREVVKSNLAKWGKKYQSELTGKSVIKSHFVRNKTPEGVKYAVEKYKADLVVMGTKGASGIKGAIWGSVASKLAKTIEKPVLVIPEHYIRFELNHIVLAIDNPTFDNKKILSPLLELAEKAKAKITTFNMAAPIVVNAEEGQEVLETSQTLLGISDDFHQSFADDLKKGINVYVRDAKADMICIIKKKRGFFIDLMHASSTKKIVFDSSVPVLVLHMNEE